MLEGILGEQSEEETSQTYNLPEEEEALASKDQEFSSLSEGQLKASNSESQEIEDIQPITDFANGLAIILGLFGSAMALAGSLDRAFKGKPLPIKIPPTLAASIGLLVINIIIFLIIYSEMEPSPAYLLGLIVGGVIATYIARIARGSSYSVGFKFLKFLQGWIPIILWGISILISLYELAFSSSELMVFIFSQVQVGIGMGFMFFGLVLLTSIDDTYLKNIYSMLFTFLAIGILFELVPLPLPLIPLI
jgi:hypothetical protein